MLRQEDGSLKSFAVNLNSSYSITLNTTTQTTTGQYYLATIVGRAVLLHAGGPVICEHCSMQAVPSWGSAEIASQPSCLTTFLQKLCDILHLQGGSYADLHGQPPCAYVSTFAMEILHDRM